MKLKRRRKRTETTKLTEDERLLQIFFNTANLLMQNCLLAQERVVKRVPFRTVCERAKERRGEVRRKKRGKWQIQPLWGEKIISFKKANSIISSEFVH